MDVIPLLFTICSILLFVIAIALLTLLERKLLGTVQRRRGPNIIGILGFLQPIADGIKLLSKEYLVLKNSSLLIYAVAPIFVFGTTISIWMIIPFMNTGLYLLEFNTLYVIALSSFGIHGIMYAGWASNSKYALLGSLRSGAQLISYELTISVIFICVILFSNAVSLDVIMDIQLMSSNIWILFPLWLIFFICSLAEGARIPFDLPEAEAELVAGYNVEYSAISFAMFFLGEYGNLILFSALSVVLFFGGHYTYSLLFAIKIAFFSSVYIVVRAAYPRYRYDQLMLLGWQCLLPLSFIFLCYLVLVQEFI